MDEEQRENFTYYLEEGSGYLGIHASDDNSHQWDWYENGVLGTALSHHPLDPLFKKATMNLEQRNAILTNALPISVNVKSGTYSTTILGIRIS